MARDDLLISTNEREFILRALRENELRVDGRGPLDVRRVDYRFGPRDGQCEVTLGQTRVLAVVSATLEQPSGGRSNEGSVSINVEFSPMASPNFEPGRPGSKLGEAMGENSTLMETLPSLERPPLGCSSVALTTASTRVCPRVTSHCPSRGPNR